MMKIKDRFQNVAVNRNGITLYRKTDALRVIDECERENIVILGIDSFFISDNYTQPSLDNSVDFTSLNICQGGLYSKARRFLNSQSNKLHFEIVYDEEA